MQDSFSLESFGARLRRIRDELIGADPDDDIEETEDDEEETEEEVAPPIGLAADGRLEPALETASQPLAAASLATPFAMTRRPNPARPALRPVPDDADVFPVHPGLTLAAEIAVRNLSAHALALRLRVPANRITAIVNGRRAITPETALRLGRFFGNPPEFWVDLQSRYDLAVARREHWDEIRRDVAP